jgi:hypothetical protein
MAISDLSKGSTRNHVSQWEGPEDDIAGEDIAMDHAGKQNARITFATSSDELSVYAPLPTFEGFHRYDPKFQWEAAVEKRVVRRIDYQICAWVCLTFFALQLDRGNISQTLSDNMLKDLGTTTND